MLVRCTIENWMSFRDPVEFSMIAGREHQHKERVPSIGKRQPRILPIAAIYGGNASGKTNFFKALSFAKELIVNGTQPDNLIPVEPFKLGLGDTEQPSRFAFELFVDNLIYEFSFAVTRKGVLEEKLVQITATREIVLYDRCNDRIEFDGPLEKDQFLQFAFRGTGDNQLFLTNSVSQKVENFRPVHDWFKDTLVLIAPDARFGVFLDKKNPLYATMNEVLPQLDTGIAHLGDEAIPFDGIEIPESVKASLKENVKEDMPALLFHPLTSDRILITREDGQLMAKKLVTFHQNADGTETKFEINQESDGSQRVIDLLPAFLDISATSSKKVYVIDELDRSLHTTLTRHLLEGYLANCSTKSRAQLLFTTHDVLLMDQQLLRRDEMWVTERDACGVSSLFSFSEYKDIRNDKDIRKSYLQGRLGGVPRILLAETLTSPCLAQESGDNA